MAKTLITILLLAVFVAAPLPSLAEKAISFWDNLDEVDDFDGPVKISRASTGSSAIFIREKSGKKVEIFILPDDYICSSLSDEIQVDFIIDDERFQKTLFVTRNSKGMYPSAKDVPFWIRKLNEGKSLKMRYTDTCGYTETREFIIQGHTRFEE